MCVRRTPERADLSGSSVIDMYKSSHCSAIHVYAIEVKNPAPYTPLGIKSPLYTPSGIYFPPSPTHMPHLHALVAFNLISKYSLQCISVFVCAGIPLGGRIYLLIPLRAAVSIYPSYQWNVLISENFKETFKAIVG